MSRGCDQCGRGPLAVGAGTIKIASAAVTRIYPNLKGARLCETCRIEASR